MVWQQMTTHATGTSEEGLPPTLLAAGVNSAMTIRAIHA